MAIMNTKGVTLRLSNSSNLLTAASSVLNITTDNSGTALITSTDSGEVNFEVLGFTTGMRIRINSAGSTGVYTIGALTTVELTMKDSSDALDQDLTTALSLTGYDMEPIGEIVSIDGPSGSVNVIDITHLGSTARTKLVGIQDEGQVSMEVWTNLTTSTAFNQWKLRDFRQSGLAGFYDICFTDFTQSATSEPSAYFFEAYVTNYSVSAALDDAVKSAIGLEISSVAHFINGINW